jgi:hypothetical protein
MSALSIFIAAGITIVAIALGIAGKRIPIYLGELPDVTSSSARPASAPPASSLMLPTRL